MELLSLNWTSTIPRIGKRRNFCACGETNVSEEEEAVVQELGTLEFFIWHITNKQIMEGRYMKEKKAIYERINTTQRQTKPERNTKM